MDIITTKLIFRLIVFTLFAYLISSCEVNEIVPESYSAEFTLSSTLFADQEFIIDPLCSEEISDFEWEISDGTTYYSKNIKHTFNDPGIYTIRLNCYTNNILVSTKVKAINVLSRGKILSSEGALYVYDVSFTNDKIVLNVSEEIGKNDADTVNYYIYTYNTELTLLSKEKKTYVSDTSSELLKSGELIRELEDFEVINFNIETHAYQRMNYKSGFISTEKDEKGEIQVSYLNESYDKLWTKEFPENNFSGDSYLAKLNDKLYFVCFNKRMDSLYIEKFSNPSIIHNQKEIGIGHILSGVENLFSFVNTNTQELLFGVYLEDLERSAVFSLDDEFNINVPFIVSGTLDAVIENVADNGTILLKMKNQIYSYTSNWELNATRIVNSDNFGIYQIGDNISLLYENLNDGTVQLSLIDKHLDTIAF